MAIHGFIAPISFPSTLKQFVGMLAKYRTPEYPYAVITDLITDLELIIKKGVVDWTGPIRAKPGDFVFWRMDVDAQKCAVKVKAELEQQGFEGLPEDLVRNFRIEEVKQTLARVMPLVDKHSGTVFAFGTVVGITEFDLNVLPRHFKGCLYAPIGGIKTLENGITELEFEQLNAETESCGEDWLRFKSVDSLIRLLDLFLRKDAASPRPPDIKL